MKLNFQQLNETKLNWYQLGKLKEKGNRTKQNKNIKQIQSEENKDKNEYVCVE